jgi:hypothetical protein
MAKVLDIPARSLHFLWCLDRSFRGREATDWKDQWDERSHCSDVTYRPTAGVPANRVKPFKNAGKSLKRIGLKIRCNICPEAMRLRRTDTRRRQKWNAKKDQETLYLEGYAMNSATILFGGEDGKGKGIGDEEPKFGKP